MVNNVSLTSKEVVQLYRYLDLHNVAHQRYLRQMFRLASTSDIIIEQRPFSAFPNIHKQALWERLVSNRAQDTKVQQQDCHCLSPFDVRLPQRY